MAKRSMIFFFGIRVKTMANFRKGTWKLRETVRCVGGGEIITDIKTLLTSTPNFFSQDYECSLPPRTGFVLIYILFCIIFLAPDF